MNKYIKLLPEVLLIAFIALCIYVLSIDLIIFNRYFLQITYLNWLFYLLPIVLSFNFLLLAVYFKDQIRLPCLIFIVLSNSYLALSLFMISGIYCEEEKNLNFIHILTVLLFTLLMIGIYYKKFYPGFNKFDLVLVVVTTSIVLAELYFNLFSYDLFYVKLKSLLGNY